MSKWTPKRVWDNEDVFIIGGGGSLKKFDWSLLKSELTIGCNDAFKLGIEICKICIFGDSGWFMEHEDELKTYKGTIFTNKGKLRNKPNIWFMPREATGLHKDALGWNFSTGAMAINLAVLLGAKQIFLLGFDMHLSKEGKINWHDNFIDKPNPEVYLKFIEGMENVKRDLKDKFPGVKVINITDDSSLDVFPKIGVTKFFKE